MLLHTGQCVDVVDGRARRIGRFHIDAVEPTYVGGTFSAGADYGDVERLFTDFAEAAEAQALKIADDCMSVIDALDLRLIDTHGNTEVRIHDLQIWSDGNASFRLREAAPSTANGTAADARRSVTSAPLPE